MQKSNLILFAYSFIHFAYFVSISFAHSCYLSNTMYFYIYLFISCVAVCVLDLFLWTVSSILSLICCVCVFVCAFRMIFFSSNRNKNNEILCIWKLFQLNWKEECVKYSVETRQNDHLNLRNVHTREGQWQFFRFVSIYLFVCRKEGSQRRDTFSHFELCFVFHLYVYAFIH